MGAPVDEPGPLTVAVIVPQPPFVEQTTILDCPTEDPKSVSVLPLIEGAVALALELEET
jgi:hypothetical protein